MNRWTSPVCLALLALPLLAGAGNGRQVPVQPANAACLAGKPCAQPVAPAWFPPLSPESYADLSGIWPAGAAIPVCWEGGGKPFAAERKLVEQSLAQAVEAATPVAFSGQSAKGPRWPACTTLSLGIRITESNTRPRSDVGRQWQADAQGTRTIEAPTRMTLNFTLDGAYKSACGKRRLFCIRVIAVHEFMHAIGFLHEHLRADTPVHCKSKWEHVADFTGYKPTRISDAFDPDSIMNYCNSIYSRATVKLSNYDIEAVERLYGRQ